MFSKKYRKVDAFSINEKVCVRYSQLSQGEQFPLRIDTEKVKSFIVNKDDSLNGTFYDEKEISSVISLMVKRSSKCKHTNVVKEEDKIRFEQIREVHYCQDCSLVLEVKTIKTLATQALKTIKRLMDENAREQFAIKSMQKKINQGVKRIEENKRLIEKINSKLENEENKVQL